MDRSKAPHQMNRRRAFTLIELLVALSLFAIILPLSGWLIYILLQAQTASANSIADTLTRSRFARTFRRDAHAARKTEVVDNGSRTGSGVVFHADSTLITYRSEPSGVIVRTAKASDASERREEFAFAGTRTRFEQKSADGTVAAVQSLDPSIASRKPQTGPSGRNVRIEAVVGRDRRYLVSPRAVGKGKS
jgi:prepilin-type N-terminal cleavage/methylation domain-containing protein